MKRIVKLAAVAAALITLGSCSTTKRSSAPSVDSGMTIPLYPVATTTKTDVELGGHWYIQTVGTIRLTGYEDADWPYLEFAPTEARFYGTNGCNIINGSYQLGSGKALALSNVATTMRSCQGDTLAFPIATAIDATRAYEIATDADGSATLSLLGSNGKTLMTLSKSEVDFLNGPWQVTALNGRAVDMPDAKLIFDLNRNHISGSAGCNRLNGDIDRNPQEGASIQLSNLATTRMTCPDIQLETELLIALESVATVNRGKGRTAVLLDSDGRPLVGLTQLDRKDL